MSFLQDCGSVHGSDVGCIGVVEEVRVDDADSLALCAAAAAAAVRHALQHRDLSNGRDLLQCCPELRRGLQHGRPVRMGGFQGLLEHVSQQYVLAGHLTEAAGAPEGGLALAHLAHLVGVAPAVACCLHVGGQQVGERPLIHFLQADNVGVVGVQLPQHQLPPVVRVQVLKGAVVEEHLLCVCRACILVSKYVVGSHSEGGSTGGGQAPSGAAHVHH
mmetsp:Transcript_34198/g.75848  ORF Transcript_34198/g.75848 Transcript_34198/m.75848 type:complete len:217 (+) Transcript_34198:897-1547(+)